MHEVPYETSCGLISCTKTRTIIIDDIKLVTTSRNVTKQICCSGYIEDENGFCVPRCSNTCLNGGECIGPEICQCNNEASTSKPGYAGKNCGGFVCLSASITSQPSTWGSECEKTCACKPGIYCDAKNGTCLPNLFIPLPSKQNEFLMPQLLTQRSSETEPQSFFAHNAINFLLCSIVVSLMMTLVWYKKRLNQTQNELYQVAYSVRSGGTGSESAYSCPSYRSSRPRLPPIPDDSDDLGKDQSFQSATRNVLFKGYDSPKPVVNPKIESHLITSQRYTEQNIYSDLDSTYRSVIEDYYACHGGRESVVIRPAYQTPVDEDSQYQVPKISPPASPKTNDDKSDIYEDIKL